MKKSILYIDTGKECGGGTKSLLYLLDNLDRKKYNPIVFFTKNYRCADKYLSEIFKNMQINNYFESPLEIGKFKKETLRIISKRLLFKVSLENRINFALGILNKFKPSLIHLNNHLSSNIEYIIAANTLNIPVIQHLRKNSTLDKIEIELLKKQQIYSISVSNAVYKFYSTFLKINKKIIYNPFPIDITSYVKKSKKLIILFPANYLKNKGHELVFEALKYVKKDFILLLAGNGKFDNKVEKLKNSFINIKELGFVNLDNYYKKADYVLSFSQNEGLPRSIIEGRLYGCGTISSDYEAAKEIYKISNKNNFFIIRRDAKNLAHVIDNLKPIPLKQPDYSLKDSFSLEKYIKEIESCYVKILNYTY